MFTMNRLRSSSPDFCRVYSLAFPSPRYSTRQRSYTSNGRGTDAETLRLSWTKDLCPPSLSISPGHFEDVTSELRLVLDELRARVAKLHLPEFRNEKFPSPRQIYNQV